MSRTTVFKDDLGFIEGPAWGLPDRLSLVSIDRGLVYTLDGGSGEILESVATGGGPNGLVVGDNVAYAAQNGGVFGASGVAAPGVQAVAGGQASYAATEGFRAPNDICLTSDGRLIVTDPATDAALHEPITGELLACDPNTGATEVLAGELLCPNGLAIDADDRFLYLTQSYARTIERFRFGPSGLVREEVVCRIDNGRPDGLALDLEGNFWVCVPASGGVNVYDPAGTQIDRIECGDGAMTTNLCFGGPEYRQVFIAAAGLGQLLTLTAPVAGLPLHPFRARGAAA
jgi:gluconolactonase